MTVEAERYPSRGAVRRSETASHPTQNGVSRLGGSAAYFRVRRGDPTIGPLMAQKRSADAHRQGRVIGGKADLIGQPLAVRQPESRQEQRR
jgi:hypothetical protein